MNTKDHCNPLPPLPWDLGKAKQVIASLEESGLPVTKFAAANGVTPHHVYHWRDRLRRQNTNLRGASAFVPVRVVEPPTSAVAPAARCILELESPHGWKIRMYGGLDAGLLAQTIKAIGGKAC